jgi:A/G-specific adenine glycosylase
MDRINFSERLLEWDRLANHRQMPWKGEKDPYRIWLSEIILQQTRVEQGLAYYERFTSVFPTLADLAGAPEKQVFKCWEGLGYYSRCRNLIATARTIISDHGGRFPASYEGLLALRGIGPYTASAIASFAFGLPHAVVDGNVQRILSRYFGIAIPGSGNLEKSLFTKLANSLLEKKYPGTYNQAIMDFGATVCKPQNPSCSACLLAEDCQAYQHQWTGTLPVKARAASKKHRWFYYLVVRTTNDKWLIRERKGQDIWKNLYEFVLWETGKLIPQQEIAGSSFIKGLLGGKGYRIEGISPLYRQTLSHQQVNGCFIHIRLLRPIPALKGYRTVTKKQLNGHPFPKFIAGRLENLLQPRF